MFGLLCDICPKRTSLESNDKLEVKIWDDVVPVYDCGKAASTWIRSCLGISAKLVVKPDEHVRSVTRNLPSPNELKYQPQVCHKKLKIIMKISVFR